MDLETVTLKGAPVSFARPLRVRLYLGTGSDQLLPGDVISCRTRLRQPRLFGTRASFTGRVIWRAAMFR